MVLLLFIRKVSCFIWIIFASCFSFICHCFTYDLIQSMPFQKHKVRGIPNGCERAGTSSPAWVPLHLDSQVVLIRPFMEDVCSGYKTERHDLVSFKCSCAEGVGHHHRHPNYLLWWKKQSAITYHMLIHQVPIDIHHHLRFFCQVFSTFGIPLCLSSTLCPQNPLLPSFFSLSYCHLPSPPTHQAGVHSGFKITL